MLAFVMATLISGLDGGVAQALVHEVDVHSESMRNLEELCDGVGPRLTGSAGLHRAQTWAAAKLTAAGATNVHLESFALGKPWQRGSERARLLNGNGLPFDIAQWGWSTGTAGVVRGPVVVLDAPTLAQFEAVAASLAGKVVLLKRRPQPTEAERGDVPAFRERMGKLWGSTAYVAVLVPSERESELLEMAGGPFLKLKDRVAFIGRDQAALFERMIARGVTPQVELVLGGAFGPTAVNEANVVAELLGTERPDEVVILGAHLDSWDLSPGATDNGAGVVAFVEVVRAMHALGLRPKRTLRVVLFAGEEQGVLGSKAYLAAHAADMARIQAVFVLDAGAGQVVALADGKVDAWAEALTAAVAPTEAVGLGPIEVAYARASGSDQEVFRAAGVPAFSARQEQGDYWSHRHHSRIDTLDAVKPESLKQATQVSALVAWGLLNGDSLPHEPPDPNPVL
jgi:carboxypeptidase Q